MKYYEYLLKYNIVQLTKQILRINHHLLVINYTKHIYLFYPGKYSILLLVKIINNVYIWYKIKLLNNIYHR